MRIANVSRMVRICCSIIALVGGSGLLLDSMNAQAIPDSTQSPAAVARLLIRRAWEIDSVDLSSRQGAAAAIAMLQEARAYAVRGKDYEDESLCLLGLTSLYKRLSVSDSALAYASQARALARLHGLGALEASALTWLVDLYIDIGRIDSVFPLTMDAFQRCQQAGCQRLADQLFVRTLQFAGMGRDTTRWFFATSELRARAADDSVALTLVHDGLGAFFSQYGMYDSAVAQHRWVLQRQRTRRETLYGMGIAFRGLHKPDSAQFYFNLQLRVARVQGDLRSEGYALGNLAAVCYWDRRPPDRRCAASYYDSAVSVASEVLRRTSGDLDRTVYGEQASELYQNWALVWLALSGSIGGDSAAAASLQIAEMGRAEALRDLMAASRSRRRRPPLGDEAPKLGTQLVMQIPRAAYTLSYLITPDTLVAWLTLPTRSIKVYRWAMSGDSVSALVRRYRGGLGADEEVIGARLRGTALATTVVHRLEAAALAQLAGRLTSAVLPTDLVKEVPEGADLVVVPNGPLNLVPFAALPLPGTAETLGEHFALRYAPSLTALVATATGDAAVSSTSRYDALVVADPSMPRVQIDTGLTFRLSPLPSARAEGEWVAARLGTRMLSGQDATESRVRSQLTHARLVHFATHAFASGYGARARDSFLALAPDSSSDGLLTVGKLMDDSTLTIPAVLVVLSGCQTALGPVFQGEGTIGLQRAFIAKGARSLLVSLWSVDDEATTTLMKRFYTHWLGDANHPSKAESLRRAQADLRAIPRYRAPLYWAAFQVVGAN